MLCTALKGFAGGLKDLQLVILGALAPEYLHGTTQKVSLHPYLFAMLAVAMTKQSLNIVCADD